MMRVTFIRVRRLVRRLQQVFIALAAAVAVAGGGAGSAPYPDRDGDGEVGEATAIRERVELYRQRHGLGDAGAPSMLDRAQFSQARALAKLRRPAGTEPGWISLGPVNGAGRAAAVVPHPEEEGVILAGASGGGIWRTVDAGRSWAPLTDHIPDLSVGAIAFAPSNPERIYLGTGEGGFAADFIPGIGLLQSLDGGATWILPTEELASQFFALDVHPEEPNQVWAATNEGLFRSDDAGGSWQEIFPGEGLVGVNELFRAPSDPDLLYAALWCYSDCPAGLARIMRSEDGGVSWTPAADGLPTADRSSPPRNRLALAVHAADPSLLYAASYLAEDAAQDVGIWASFDGGRSWQATTDPGPYLGNQGWYDNAIAVHPGNPQIVVAAGIGYVVSHDGGASWLHLNPYDNDGDGMGTDTIPHVDGQDLQWQGDTLWLACDGGIWSSEDYGLSWTGRNDGLVTRQYYGLDIDPMNSAILLGGTQDNASNLRSEADDDSWAVVVGGDGFDCAINPYIPELMYGTQYRTQVFRNWQGGVGEWEDISPNKADELAPFFTSLTMRPQAPWMIYTGAESVYRSTNAGDSWKALETVVANGVWTQVEISSIAVTPADPELIMVAKVDSIFTSDDDGGSWWKSTIGRQVNHIGISPLNRDLAFAGLARALDGSDQLLKSSDRGRSWQASGSGLPPFSVHVVRWHPTLPEVAYAGTDVGLYGTTDGGASWSEVGDGLPSASVHDLRLSADGNRIVAATHGRGAWQIVLAESSNRPPSIRIEEPTDGALARLGETIQFRAAAEDPDGGELTVQWIFGDRWGLEQKLEGTSPLVARAEHVYERAEDFLVAAHVRDEHGASSVATITMQGHEPGDSCQTPRVVPGAGPFPISFSSENRNASEEESDPDPPCVSRRNDPVMGRWGSVWFELTPERDATYAVSTCGSWADTVLSAWTGPPCGPYETVVEGCNDDDDYVHCTGERTDSYLELQLTAGQTYRFMVGGWSEGWTGPFRFHVECADCEHVTPDRSYVVPAAAATPGANGTQWITDLSLLNPGQLSVNAELELRGGATPGTPVPLTIPAGAAVDLRDVVGNALATSGSGALHVAASDALVVASRTYNNASSGTYGQGIPGLLAGSGIGPGGAARLVGLSSTGEFRTNLGLTNASDQTVAVEIELYGQYGSPLATRSETLAPHAWRQLNRIFELEELGEQDAAYAIVRNRSLAGELFPYASVVDETSGDPIFISNSPVVGEDGFLWIPAAAHTPGVGGTQWRTDLDLANFGAQDCRVTVELLPSDNDNSAPQSAEVRIAANAVQRVPDALQELFEFTGTAALRLSVDRGLLMLGSRTYTAGTAGTYGQYIPGFDAAQIIDADRVGLLAPLRTGAEFRTNLGMVNLSGGQLAVSVRFYDAEHGYLGARSYSVKPYAHFQVGGSVPDDDVDFAYAVVQPATDDGKLLAYASVVDNRSGDPVFVPAVIIED